MIEIVFEGMKFFHDIYGNIRDYDNLFLPIDFDTIDVEMKYPFNNAHFVDDLNWISIELVNAQNPNFDFTLHDDNQNIIYIDNVIEKIEFVDPKQPLEIKLLKTNFEDGTTTIIDRISFRYKDHDMKLKISKHSPVFDLTEVI